MKVKIIKCSNNDFWYCNNIGETYNVLLTDYQTNEHIIKKAVFGFFGGKSIDINDCEIISN